MLNSDDLLVQATAEKSLKLHMQKCKVRETEEENNFTGYKIAKNNLVFKNISTNSP